MNACVCTNHLVVLFAAVTAVCQACRRMLPPPTWVEIVEGSEHQGWYKLLETVVAGAAP